MSRLSCCIAALGVLLLGAAQSHTPLTIGRLQYYGGGDWYADPSSLPNLLAEINMTGHGNVQFSAEEVRTLRLYLESGGFLHADDNYGMDESFRREISRVFPDRELADVPLDHPVYRAVYQFPQGLPKIHEHDGLPARGLGIFIDGRLAVFYSYQSDLGDGWEDPDVHRDPAGLREASIRMGVNLFVYAVTATP